MLSRKMDPEFYSPLMSLVYGYDFDKRNLDNIWECMSCDSDISGFIELQKAMVANFIKSTEEQFKNKPESQWTGWAKELGKGKWKRHRKDLEEYVEENFKRLDDLRKVIKEARWLMDSWRSLSCYYFTNFRYLYFFPTHNPISLMFLEIVSIKSLDSACRDKSSRWIFAIRSSKSTPSFLISSTPT